MPLDDATRRRVRELAEARLAAKDQGIVPIPVKDELTRTAITSRFSYDELGRPGNRDTPLNSLSADDLVKELAKAKRRLEHR